MAANAAVVAELVYAWLDNRLPETLRLDQNASRDEQVRAVGVPSLPAGLEGMACFRFLCRFTYGNFGRSDQFGLEL